MSTKIQIGERVALQDIVNKNNRVRQAFLCRTGYTGFGKWRIELIENGNSISYPFSRKQDALDFYNELSCCSQYRD